MHSRVLLNSLICLALVLFLSISCLAQTCKNGITPFQPAPCKDCTICTGSSTSCCSNDQFIARILMVSKLLVSEQCLEMMKVAGCAVCDPKNQDYILSKNSDYVVRMCKSTCLKMSSACTTLDCSGLPDTNCWSSAQSILKSSSSHILGVVIAIISILLMTL